ncbi:MAG TPA: flagellar biosynthesis protein FlgD [Clostridiaceae bacterium]|nr:flagellar biosynthesis protein FlgD [Clostridiaceae bacterium]
MSTVSNIGTTKTIEQIIEEQAKSSASTRNTGELGKDDFLKLLITQVQNQDPMNPASDTDFIAQMAQFSALEQMQNLNRTFSYTAGFAMLGKYVTGEIRDDNGDVKYVSGKAESVRVMNGQVYVVVGDDDVPIDKIAYVSDENAGIGEDVTDFSAIIGLLAKARLTSSSGKESPIEGIIASVVKEGKKVYARLDEVEVKPYNLDIGAFENEEEYIKGMIGQEITVKFEDELTGEKFTVTGILRAGYEGEDGELRLLLDNVKVPAGSIYSVQGIDLLSTEQMLLNAILRELQKLTKAGDQNGTDPDETDPEGSQPDDEGTV